MILGSCALYGPTYQKPEVASSNSWRSQISTAKISNTSLSDTAWWTRFNDPVLNDLILDALKNNNDIQIAIGNMVIAGGKLKQITMGWVPTINLGAGGGVGQLFNANNSSPNPALAPIIGTNSNPQDFNYYGAGLMPTYTLNVMQQLRKDEVARANVTATLAAKNAVRLGIISQVAGSYFTLLALQEEQKIQQQMIMDLTQVVDLLNIQYQNGLIAKTDVIQYEQNLAEAKMQLPTILHNITTTENALQTLINKNPSSITLKRKLNDVVLDNAIPVNLPSKVLENRPDIIQAVEQLKLANANIGVATSNFFPSIMLTTPFGGYNAQLTGLFNSSGDYWVAQAAAVMPILNLGLYGIVKQAKGRYYIAYYEYVKAVRTAFTEVDDSLSSYANLQQTMKEATSLYNTTNSNYQLNQINYKNGYTSYPESLVSQISLHNVQMKLTQVKLQQLQSLVRLYQAMAGGYNYQNHDTPKKFGDGHDAT